MKGDPLPRTFAGGISCQPGGRDSPAAAAGVRGSDRRVCFTHACRSCANTASLPLCGAALPRPTSAVEYDLGVPVAAARLLRVERGATAGTRCSRPSRFCPTGFARQAGYTSNIARAFAATGAAWPASTWSMLSPAPAAPAAARRRNRRPRLRDARIRPRLPWATRQRGSAARCLSLWSASPEVQPRPGPLPRLGDRLPDPAVPGPPALLLLSFAGHFLLGDDRAIEQFGQLLAQAAPALDPAMRRASWRSSAIAAHPGSSGRSACSG